MSASVRMRQKKGFEFPVCEGCRELASDVGRVSKRTRFKRSSRSIRAWWRALRSIAPDADPECSISDENEVCLTRRESCTDFPEVSMQLLDPSKRTLAACGGFSSRGKHHNT